MTRRRKVLLSALAVLAVLGVLISRLFVWPSTASSAHRADAVVLLAGASYRLPVAQHLAAAGPGVLVVSAAGGEENADARALCEDPGDLTVHCFAPSPVNTRGEAQAIGALVEEQGWERITVVTSTAHVTRARLLIDRCTDAGVDMVDAPRSLTVFQWAGLVLHEIGGLTQGAVSRGC